jgi:hypothetical protein
MLCLDRGVGIATGYGLESSGSIPGSARFLSSRKLFGIWYMCIYTFLLRMADTMTSHNIDLSPWDTLCMYIYIYFFSHCFVGFLLFFIISDSIELSPSWKAAGCSDAQKYFQHFVEPEVQLPCSHEPYTSLYPEPDRSSPYRPILFQ